ncbi:hypothetical protein [Streptomyces sp. NPDC001389]|uniref:hypothetical protein n=1 Tax=Streptomyces sp. NPDC001389 TaxID=3364569 RepID=UPI0036C5439B
MKVMQKLYTLADGDLIPNAKPTKIPGVDETVGKLFGYGLWLIILAGAAGAGYGLYKLALSDKSSRSGGGAEPAKWMGGGIAAILLAGSLIAILNGISGG